MLIHDLLNKNTGLSPEQIAYLQKLTLSWGTVADLFLGDLMLFVDPGDSGSEEQTFLCVDHIRSLMVKTLYVEDQVGMKVTWPIIGEAFDGNKTEELIFDFPEYGRTVRSFAVPVRHNGTVIAVLVAQRINPRNAVSLVVGLYMEMSERFINMIAASDFPYAHSVSTKNAPRVGDGALHVNRFGKILNVTPNCVSTMRRIGFNGSLIGKHLHDIGFDRQKIMSSIESSKPCIDEFQKGDESLLLLLLPLIEDKKSFEGLALIRDISDIRQHDRLAISLDTTVREIHHRVKNNLQTVSALLRLQSRRLSSSDAKAAIDDSVRRIASIAVVHELLSKKGVDDVHLQDVIQPLVAMTKSALVGPDCPIRIEVSGDNPLLPERLVNSIAIVVTELLQNAVEHGYSGTQGGTVKIEIEDKPATLQLKVIDDGEGLPETFSKKDFGLGLTLAKKLTKDDFKGDLTLEPSVNGFGTTATIKVISMQLQPALVSRDN